LGETENLKSKLRNFETSNRASDNYQLVCLERVSKKRKVERAVRILKVQISGNKTKRCQ